MSTNQLQSASISINQNQSASIRINQHQSASNCINHHQSASVSVNQHKSTFAIDLATMCTGINAPNSWGAWGGYREILRSVRRLCEKVVRGWLQELLSELTNSPKSDWVTLPMLQIHQNASKRVKLPVSYNVYIHQIFHFTALANMETSKTNFIFIFGMNVKFNFL